MKIGRNQIVIATAFVMIVGIVTQLLGLSAQAAPGVERKSQVPTFPLAIFGPSTTQPEPLRLSDTVEAECRLLEAGTRSVRFCVRFFDPTGQLAAEARSVQVATGADFGPRPVPDWLRAAVEASPAPEAPGAEMGVR